MTRRNVFFLLGFSLVLGAGGLYLFVVKPLAVREAGSPSKNERPGRAWENASFEDRRLLEEESRRINRVSGVPRDPTADVRRTLETLQDIQHLNRMNQEQQRRQQQPPVPPPPKKQ
jgi:hypothetical protein